jgi:hypothetical protein
MRVKQETLFRGNINFVEFHSANEFNLVREVMETIEKEIGVSSFCLFGVDKTYIIFTELCFLFHLVW